MKHLYLLTLKELEDVLCEEILPDPAKRQKLFELFPEPWWKLTETPNVLEYLLEEFSTEDLPKGWREALLEETV